MPWKAINEEEGANNANEGANVSETIEETPQPEPQSPTASAAGDPNEDSEDDRVDEQLIREDKASCANEDRARLQNRSSNGELLKAPGRSCKDFAPGGKKGRSKKPCTNNHIGLHQPWPTTGRLVIKSCEVTCQVCGKTYSGSAGDLRRHVYTQHRGPLFDPNAASKKIKLYTDVEINRRGGTA